MNAQRQTRRILRHIAIGTFCSVLTALSFGFVGQLSTSVDIAKIAAK